MSEFKTLKVTEPDACTTPMPVITPELTLASPAQAIVNDFNFYNPLQLHRTTLIDDALMVLKSSASHFLLVTDKEQLVGVVSAADLQSTKVLRLANSLGFSRAELTLEDICDSCLSAKAVNERVLEHAKIGDVLQTMEHYGVMYLYVLSSDGMRIGGLISAREISRRLHIPLHITPIANSLHDVMMSVEHP